MEYTTPEMIAKLCENNELKFETKRADSIVEAHAIKNKIFCLFKNSCLSAAIGINDKWTLIQKPVDFMTAANSGKRIKLFEPEKYEFLTLNSPEQYFSVVDRQLRSISSYLMLEIIQLLNAKWLIED